MRSVAQWLATCGRKSNVVGSSPATSMMFMKQVETVGRVRNTLPVFFFCSVNRECHRKENSNRKKKNLTDFTHCFGICIVDFEQGSARYYHSL